MMADYRPDHKGTGQLMRGVEMHLMLIDTAFDAIPFAQAISPDAPPYGVGYREHFEVDGSHTERIAGTKRAVCYLRNTSEYAAAVEFGWDVEHGQRANHPGYHVLAKVADHIEGII